MTTRALAVISLAAGCIVAAAGGAYVAVRENNTTVARTAEAPAPAESPAVPAAARPVAETEAVVAPPVADTRPTPAPRTPESAPVRKPAPERVPAPAVQAP